MRFNPLAIVVLLCCLPALATAEYVAFSVSDDGERSPLPSRIDDIDAKYLVNVEWGQYDGRRARAGVLDVENKSTASTFRVRGLGGDIDFSSSATGIPVDGIEAIVIDAMNRSGRFRLVERTELDSVLGEQDLASSGRVARPSGAATGKILGAEILVQLVITDYEPGTSGKDIGVGGLLKNKVPVLGGVKIKNREGRIGMNLRLIDAETSEITFSKQIESTIKESGLAFGGAGLVGDLGLGGFMSQFSKTPIGLAVIAGVNEAVFEIVGQIGAKPAEGSVIKADPDAVYVNLGQDQVSVGERLTAYSRGEELIDPETGISLGGSRTELGDLEIVKVEEKFSIARPLNMSSLPERGDPVVSRKPPPTMEYAQSFDPPRRRRR